MLKTKPAVIGHSFGGLIAQRLAGEGVAVVTVAVDPAPFRGVLPLPLSALKSASAVLANPFNYTRAVPLTFEQFRFAFANAVDEPEAHELYETFAVPACQCLPVLVFDLILAVKRPHPLRVVVDGRLAAGKSRLGDELVAPSKNP